MKKATSTFDHLKSILALPFMVLVIIPGILFYLTRTWNFNPIEKVPNGSIIGVILVIIGLLLFAQSVILFVKVGKGTLAPWDPTKKLVVKSLYRYVRNPMILGVLIILLAESLLFSSTILLVWAMTFFLINHIYFVSKEEPDLIKRFGVEFTEYLQNVPRWLPRIKGWKPENQNRQ